MLIKQLLETRIDKSHQPNCIEKAKEVLLSAIFAFDGSVQKNLLGTIKQSSLCYQLISSSEWLNKQ